MANFPEPQDIIAYLDKAREIARCGAEVSSKYFNTALEIESKSDDSPVTIADKNSELAMRDYIQKSFPGQRILGEEHGLSGDKDSPWTWVLDPIDGTKSFIHGIPLYTVLVALMYEDQPMLGVIYNPQTEEMLSAGIGMGCWYNGEQTKVSKREKLSDARLQLTCPTHFIQTVGEPAVDIIRAVKMTRTWADAHGYLLVATGRADVMIDPEMSLWDVACLQPIITEAEGEFTDIHGKHIVGSSAVATNGLIHEEVMQLLGVKDYHRH